MTSITTHDVGSMTDAREKMIELGIPFDRAITHPIVKRHSTIPDHETGVHVHFMRGDSDVAYFTPLMHSLVVLDSPRKWSPEFLDAAITYPCDGHGG